MLFYINSANMLKVKQGGRMDSYLLVISNYDPTYQYLYKLTDKFFEDNILQDLEGFVDSCTHENNDDYCIFLNEEQPINISGKLYIVVGDF